jgi:hypothetical protein
MKLQLLKVAWVRQPDVPAGQPAPGQLQCECANAPLTHYRPGPDVICNCGRRYTWDGWIVDEKEGGN